MVGLFFVRKPTTPQAQPGSRLQQVKEGLVYIRDNKIESITTDIQTGKQHGMQTMNQALADLVEDRRIDLDDAVACSSDPDDLLRLLRSD